MQLSEKQVRAIAADARIALSDDQLAAMTVDLNQILDNIQAIKEFDLSEVEPTFHPIAGLNNVMRDDEAARGLNIEQVLGNAPDQLNRQFRVPPILGELGDNR